MRSRHLTVWFLALLAGASLGCSRTNISRKEWQSMPQERKTLYVRTLIGQQKAKAAKGGNNRIFAASPEDYVTTIDAAYARGDERSADKIFEELGVRR